MMLSSTTSSRLASSISRHALLSSSSRRLASPSGVSLSTTTTINDFANESTTNYVKTRLALSAMAMAMGGSILAASTGSGRGEDDTGGVAKCMTINAVVGKNNFDARNYLLDGLDRIKSRGYDGAGIATMGATRGDMVSALTHLYHISLISASCCSNVTLHSPTTSSLRTHTQHSQSNNYLSNNNNNNTNNSVTGNCQKVKCR